MKTLSAPKFWFSQNLTAWLLLPISLVMCGIAVLRRLSYRIGYSFSESCSKPVVVVGNIAVGGTGKSPLLVTLCELLTQQGLGVGIVSRGYGSELVGPYTVSDTDSPQMVGDEPLMLVKRTSCTLVIAEARPNAVNLLESFDDIDVILSDDGMQHYAMERDIEIAVVDAGWMHGNGFCMPSGPLREPASRLNSVDYVVYNKTSRNTADSASDDGDELQGFRLEIDGCRNLKTNAPCMIKQFKGQTVHAVAGIGTPGRFFEQLRVAGLDVIEHPFDDHYLFKAEDLMFDDELAVLITEKDAVKCKAFKLEQVWTVIVDAVLDAPLEQALISHIKTLCDEQKAA